MRFVLFIILIMLGAGCHSHHPPVTTTRTPPRLHAFHFKIWDATQKPLAGAIVRLSCGSLGNRVTRGAESDAAGLAMIRIPASERCSITTELDGYRSQSRRLDEYEWNFVIVVRLEVGQEPLFLE